MDAHDNAEVALPADEQITWPCLWLAELYAPSHAEKLVAGLDDLNDAQTSMFRHEPPANWMKRARSWTGGYWKIGEFSNQHRLPGQTASAGVPKEFSGARGVLKQIAPGVTVVVLQFSLTEENSGCLQEVMRQSFETRVAPIKGQPGGEHVYGPEFRKAERLKEVRGRFRRLAEGWVGDRVPGFFSELEGFELPSWDLLLSENAHLFGGRDALDKRWREVLGYGETPEQWQATELPGLRLAQPMGANSAPVSAILGRKAEGLALLEGAHMGEGVGSLVHLVDRKVVDHWALWAMRDALGAYERLFSDIRDQLAPPPGRFGSGRRLKRLRAEVMPLAFDLRTLEEAAGNEMALAMPTRYSGTEFDRVRRKPHVAKMPPKTLLTVIAAQIQDRGAKVAGQGREISEGLRVQAELLLAASNIRLQRAVLALTVLVGAAGVVATIASS